MLQASFQQRLHDLEDHVTQDLRLLKQYEDRLRLIDDPKQEARYHQEVEQLRMSAQQYQRESNELREQLATKLSTERQNLEKERQTNEEQLNQIATNVKALMGGQAIMLSELTHTRQTLLDHYDAAQQKMIGAIADQLDHNQLLVTQELLNALDGDRFSQREIEQLWAVLEEQIPALPSQQAHVVELLKAPQLDAKHKLKVTLPIVPFLVDYEGELELGSGFNLKTAWNTLISKLRLKSQQPPTHKPIGQVAMEIRQHLTDDDRRWSVKDGAVNHDHYIYGTPKAEPRERFLPMRSTGLP